MGILEIKLSVIKSSIQKPDLLLRLLIFPVSLNYHNMQFCRRQKSDQKSEQTFTYLTET